MLTKHPKFEGKVVEAWTEPCYRAGGEETRYKLVVDETDTPLGAVTDQYTLIRNADLLSAVEVASDIRGVRLDPLKGAYRSGKSVYHIMMPDYGYRVGADTSDTNPTIILRNDYRGGGGLKIQGGFFRVICTNGLIRGEIAHYSNIRHVGKIDLLHFVETAILKTVEMAEVNRLLAETLAGVRAPEWSEIDQLTARELVLVMPGLPEVIQADTADRYHGDLARAVRENTSAIGNNLWAIAQAVAEVATHRMQERHHYNMAADEWAARQLQRIEAFAQR